MNYVVTKNPEVAGVLVPWFVLSHGQTRASVLRELVERLVFDGRLATCLVHKKYGYEKKPILCRLYPKKGQLCRYYRGIKNE